MKDDFELPRRKNEEFIELSNLRKLWDVAFKKLISEEGEIINNELLNESKINKRRKEFIVNKISRLSIDNYLYDIKNLN